MKVFLFIFLLFIEESFSGGDDYKSSQISHSLSSCPSVDQNLSSNQAAPLNQPSSSKTSSSEPILLVTKPIKTTTSKTPRTTRTALPKTTRTTTTKAKRTTTTRTTKARPTMTKKTTTKRTKNVGGYGGSVKEEETTTEKNSPEENSSEEEATDEVEIEETSKNDDEEN